VLVPHVFQKGSNITRERLRFDFSHPKPMTREEIERVERWVQDAIDERIPVTSEVMALPEAQAKSAIGLFTDKHGGQSRFTRLASGRLNCAAGLTSAIQRRSGVSRLRRSNPPRPACDASAR
jgi:alanyl-tRNA synthetase